MKYNNVSILNNVLQILKQDYGLLIVSSKFIPFGEESYTYFVTTDKGEKLFIKYCDHEEVIKKINELLLQLKYLDFVIPPIATNGKISIYPYIEGEVIHKGNDKFEKKLVNKLTEIMAQIHNAKTDVDLPIEKFENGFLERFTKLEASIDDSEVINLLKENKNVIVGLINKHNMVAEKYKNGKSEFVLTHGDITGLNIIRSKDGLKLTDWDGAYFAPKERDFMFLIDSPYFSIKKYYQLTEEQNYDPRLVEYYKQGWALNSIIGNFESLLNHNQIKQTKQDYFDEINQYLGYYK